MIVKSTKPRPLSRSNLSRLVIGDHVRSESAVEDDLVVAGTAVQNVVAAIAEQDVIGRAADVPQFALGRADDGHPRLACYIAGGVGGYGRHRAHDVTQIQRLGDPFAPGIGYPRGEQLGSLKDLDRRAGIRDATEGGAIERTRSEMDLGAEICVSMVTAKVLETRLNEPEASRA